VAKDETPVEPKGSSPEVRPAQLLWVWKEIAEIAHGADVD
jgi:predicted chitinase